MDVRELTEHERIVEYRTIVCGLEHHLSLDIPKAEATMHETLLIWVPEGADIPKAEQAVKDVCSMMNLKTKPEQVDVEVITS